MKYKGLLGYFPHDSNITWGEIDPIVTIGTAGTDCDGYPQSEILGVGLNEFEGYVLFRGSNRGYNSHCPTIHLNCDKRELILTLRSLADSLEM